MILEFSINRYSIYAAKSAFVFVQLTVKFLLRIINVKTVFVDFVKVIHEGQLS